VEEVEGKRAMEWVRTKNAATEAVLTKTSLYQPIFDRTMKILDSQDRIAFPNIIGDRLYNYWQDATHPRGLLRRTSWSSYLSGKPVWEPVIDIDALSKTENVPWAFAGASCLEPANAGNAARRCHPPKPCSKYRKATWARLRKASTPAVACTRNSRTRKRSIPASNICT